MRQGCVSDVRTAASTGEIVLRQEVDRGSDAQARTANLPIGSLVAAGACALALAACITTLELASDRAMDLGGFLASGGAYAIEHHVPAWSWIWPVSFVGVWVFAFAHALVAWRAGGFNLVLPTWCALFLWAGVSFLRHAFSPPGGGALDWGWLVCGVVFTATGALPLLLFLPQSPVVNSFTFRFASRPGVSPAEARRYRVAYCALHAAAIACGVAVGFAVIDAIAR